MPGDGDLIRAVLDDAPLDPDDKDGFDRARPTGNASKAKAEAPKAGQVRAGPAAMFALRDAEADDDSQG